jgi:hypothetical protein
VVVKRVESAPVPATTGTLASAASTVTSMSWRRSALVSMVNSPVLRPGDEPTDAGTDQPVDDRGARAAVARAAMLGEGRDERGQHSGEGLSTGHRSDWGVDAFGGREPGPGGGLDVPRLGEVIARQAQVLVRAERALQHQRCAEPWRATWAHHGTGLLGLRRRCGRGLVRRKDIEPSVDEARHRLEGAQANQLLVPRLERKRVDDVLQLPPVANVDV